MNAERLHKILLDFEADFQTLALLPKIESVQSNLENQVNQPNQPNHQKGLVSSLEQLYSSLQNSKYNSFSP